MCMTGSWLGLKNDNTNRVVNQCGDIMWQVKHVQVLVSLFCGCRRMKNIVKLQMQLSLSTASLTNQSI
jgi:methyl coenzyme M reductase alpha subunit